ncbi:hypothetical protein DDV21_009425 [Streptococcus chenjunshii]|uniref:Uncharacterized protein n=1 Tax=Streptococcus chenjunshii TaxID=2173853 RepID=A0A346NBH6_9STRE|nr:hypothetical protein [Streptococcus chenjunshii]AXQ78371.1 hypothetical protein DDV21_004405 [Streptococcus chenjunshii]AXQ79280.1 hypothetical protein DDV21_009425 [Streptococcus chenjunshii]RFU49946.1 hypothetical protein DDV22_11250 [Streptococcus chenjunshii]RFU52135.1 hypothetical protein DDV23_11285 [Streptococcus chenjunshii]
MDIVNAVTSALTGKSEEEIKAIRKSLEWEAVKSLLAPSLKAERRSLVSDYDEKIDARALQAKSEIEALGGQLDKAIKGAGRKAIETVLSDHLEDYDKI